MWRNGLYLAAMERDSWWALVSVRYGMYRGAMERYIWRALVNVMVWFGWCSYGELQLVGTGVCGRMSSNERLCSLTGVGPW
jgi:3-methyladenine DNA glycosylase/8-oxoguanine DNA glycosylase